mgnify:CR=1 FL=1
MKIPFQIQNTLNLVKLLVKQVPAEIWKLWKTQPLVIGFCVISTTIPFLLGFLIVSNILWSRTQDELGLFYLDLERRMQICEVRQEQIIRRQIQLDATLMSLRSAIRQRNKDLPIK